MFKIRALPLPEIGYIIDTKNNTCKTNTFLAPFKILNDEGEEWEFGLNHCTY